MLSTCFKWRDSLASIGGEMYLFVMPARLTGLFMTCDWCYLE
jgi:hypothetical protein